MLVELEVREGTGRDGGVASATIRVWGYVQWADGMQRSATILAGTSQQRCELNKWFCLISMCTHSANIVGSYWIKFQSPISKCVIGKTC